MVSRRQVLVRGSGALAALNLGLAGRYASAANAAHAPTLFLVDATLAGSDAAIEAARRAGIPVAFFAGDIGTAWLDHLEPLWRDAPAPIAGLTSAGALFCAEQLARGHGLTCSFKSTTPAHANAPLLWSLGPQGSDIMGWSRS